MDALFSGLIIACFVVLVTPTLGRWYQQKQTLEVYRVSQAIYDAEIAYFESQKNNEPPADLEPQPRLRGVNPFAARNDPRKFLALPPTPETIAPYAQQAAFSQRPWSLLKLNIDSSLRYQYQVTTNGLSGTYAGFEIIAFGNRDGDKVLSQWRLRGFLDPNGKPLGRDTLYRLDPLE
jgi:hypothetical protein